MAKALPRVRWPHSYPVCLLGGIASALCLTALSAFLQVRQLPPLQRCYLVPFLKATVLPTAQNIRLVEVQSSRGWVTAVDPWVALRADHGRIGFVLTDSAMAAGLSHPRFVDVTDAKPRVLRRFFEASIYRSTLAKTFRITLCVFAFSLIVGMMVGAHRDQKHQEEARRGVQIRGPVLMTPQRARRYLNGNGIALFLEPKAK